MALATLIVVVGASCGGDSTAKAPLVVSPPQSAAFDTTIAHPFTFGDIYVANAGNDPVVLEKVSMVDPSRGVEIVGTRARRATFHTFVLAGDDNWPPSSVAATRYYTGLRPLAGMSLAAGTPSHGVQILVGIHQTRDGRAVIRSFQISYRSGGHPYTATVPYALTMCVSNTHCRQPPLPETPKDTRVFTATTNH